jgi:hypothetical protein
MAPRHTIQAALVLALPIAPAAHAGFYQYSGVLSNGYAVRGVLETMGSAPASFIESNPNFPNTPFATQYLQGASLTVSRFGAQLGQGLPVINGVSFDPYLYVGFNSAAPSISALDLNTRGTAADSTPYYFISNGTLPSYTSVPYGSTNFNLFLFDPSTSTATFLASTSTISVTVIPAPAGLLAFALLPVMRGRRRR